MKILVGLSYYDPHWTGLTNYAQLTAEGLAKRGHDVTVVTSRHDPRLPAEEMIRGVRVVRLPVVARVSRTMVMPTYPLAMWRLIAQHDLVHVHTPMPESLATIAMARGRGRPSVITHHGDVVMPARAMNRLIQGTMHVTMGAAMRHADAVITHSGDYARHSRFLAPLAATIKAIYPPTVIRPAQPAAVADMRAELGLESAFVIGFAGRFVEEKGFDLLLDAMPGVITKAPHARFVFAGEMNVVYERFHDRCARRMEALREYITSLGLILDRQQVACFYSMCDLFVLPSRTDCFPAVQVEAMLSGTPVLTSDIPGAREAVQVSGAGRLFRAADPAALAEAIVAAVEDPMPSPEPTAVRAIFDSERAISEYETVMNDLVGKRTPERSVVRQKPVNGLAGDDLAVVARLTRNEADMAYRRRVPTLMRFLRLRRGDTVLDCGSGYGYLSLVMAGLRDIELVNVDGDRQRLIAARGDRVPGSPAAADVHMLPFRDRSFGKVLMSEVLEHLDDDDVALAEVWRVLEPGGLLAVSVPHGNYPFWWDPVNKIREAVGLQPIRRMPFSGQWTDHRRLYLPADLEEVLCRRGFEVLEVVEQTSRVFPLNHLLVYGIGKPLLQKGLLPTRLRMSADRFQSEQNSGSWLNPINLAVSVLRRVDRRNDRPTGRERCFVSLLAAAQKPLEDQDLQ